MSVKQAADLSGGGAFGKPSGGGNGRAGASLFEPLRAMEGESWIDLDHYHAEVSPVLSGGGVCGCITKWVGLTAVLPRGAEALAGSI